MAKKRKKDFNEYTSPLNMNGLRGRVLHLPQPSKKKKQQILLVYGHHASIERMHGFAEELNRYGAVTLPDLPGFGGMESFYKIGEKPTLDNLADYLAAFIKMRYKHRRLTIVGMSFGFVVVTRMLQRYPDIAKKVDELVSVVGFVHYEDFKMKASTRYLLRGMSYFFSLPAPAIFARYLLLSRPVIHATYHIVGDNNVKMKDANPAERLKRIRFEVKLWQSNDVRTYCYTGMEMLRVNLCDKSKPINLVVSHVKVNDDRYFDNRVVEQHLNVVYKEVQSMDTKLVGHAPTVVSSAKEAAPFIPKQLRSLLKSV